MFDSYNNKVVGDVIPDFVASYCLGNDQRCIPVLIVEVFDNPISLGNNEDGEEEFNLGGWEYTSENGNLQIGGCNEPIPMFRLPEQRNQKNGARRWWYTTSYKPLRAIVVEEILPQRFCPDCGGVLKYDAEIQVPPPEEWLNGPRFFCPRCRKDYKLDGFDLDFMSRDSYGLSYHDPAPNTPDSLGALYGTTDEVLQKRILEAVQFGIPIRMIQHKLKRRLKEFRFNMGVLIFGSPGINEYFPAESLWESTFIIMDYTGKFYYALMEHEYKSKMRLKK
ncbi:MAG: hypothetical protein PHZ07_04470 [Patescibacteria group bacterium]|nr:hypothetical protein [Patescibacteria group bacterium]MDD4304002.1 hypothetical protein [Patescibacteria group bacterium]MDD4695009.1 hypothetical protein [Patescibacteria group bacterium]